MLWGYQNGWFPEFLPPEEPKIWGKLQFLRRWGLHETTVDIGAVSALDSEELAKVVTFLREYDMHLNLAVWYDYVGSDDTEATAAHEALVRDVTAFVEPLRTVAVFTRAGCGHRFSDGLPLVDRLAILSQRLAPLAAVCRSLGTPLGINNQGDFYIDDFCDLCDRTPDLHLWLDTANIFWAGEPIFPAFERAAERTIATHWRDERIVLGNTKPRGVLLENCITGQGHVDLPRCYQTLLARAPDTDRLLMEVEFFPPSGVDRKSALEEALAFCRDLNGGAL